VGYAICYVHIFALGPACAQPIPPEVSNSANQWPLANKDYSNSRVATGSSITSANVHQLQRGWTFEFPPEAQFVFGAAAANPIIAEDVVYMQDLASNIYALQLGTGELLWENQRDLLNAGPNGVAVGWGKVFALGDERSFVALDKETGAQVWSTTLSAHPGEGIDIQPTLYNGLVYTSTVPVTIEGFLQGLDGYLPGSVGVIHALDQRTGESVWQFNTVDSADIWGNAQLNSGGGAWYTPAIDTASGMTYWGTGNPAPWPGTEAFPNGASRPGPNLYTNSMIALDGTSGELKWHNQVRPHDLFDYDFQNAPILATLTIDEVEREIVIGAGKMGSVFAFDRNTGERLWARDVGIHQNDDLTEIPPGVTLEVFPGALGGVETPMALADGVVYVPVVNLPSLHSATKHLGFPGGFPDGLAAGTGELTAIDARTGIVLWNTRFDSMVLGGATVVNDLVFTSTFDGMIYALDRATGEAVWSYQAQGGINFLPAVAEDRIIFPIGLQTGDTGPHLLALMIPEPSAAVLAAWAFAVLVAARRKSVSSLTRITNH
jgi:glucose dehydrogenase